MTGEVANLLIEVGNTALKAAWAEGMTLGKAFRFQGEKVMEFILSLTEKEKPEVMAVVSAKPVTPAEEEILRGECRHLMILDSAHPDILQRYDLPDYLSYDRAASLLAVRYLFKGKPCVVFDFGTTLTIGSESFTLTNLSKMYFSTTSETTGIAEAQTISDDEVEAIYDLSGHQVTKEQMRRGVYIIKTRKGTSKVTVK